jgi:mRNA-degrading endonuclease RelE of RelBE toxin-antitoxin system
MGRYWTISVDARAVRGLYALPRGVAGQVTDALEALRSDPIPADVEPVEELQNTYQLAVADHIVEYEVVAEKRLIKVLNVA